MGAWMKNPFLTRNLLVQKFIFSLWKRGGGYRKITVVSHRWKDARKNFFYPQRVQKEAALSSIIKLCSKFVM